MRAATKSRRRSSVAAIAGFALLIPIVAIVALPASVANASCSSANVITPDTPELHDEIRTWSWLQVWSHRDSPQYVFARPKSFRTDAWAHWDFGCVNGNYSIEVKVPNPGNRYWTKTATAHAQYRLERNNNRSGAEELDTDQAKAAGWVSLGVRNFDGVEVDIYMDDDETRDGTSETLALRKLVADSIRLVRRDGCQPTDSWTVRDNPNLFDNDGGWSYSWTWWRNTGGYGGIYHHTWSYRDGNSTDNWAHWDLGCRSGRYRIEAYLPGNGTSNVTYGIVVDNQNNNDAHLADPTLNQSGKSGWRSIGEYDLNGYVNVYLADTDALDNGRRITADAMRVVRLGALSSSNEADTTDEAVDLDGVILTNPAGYDPPVSGQGCTSNRDGRGWPIGQCTAYVMWRLDREGLPRYITDRGNHAQYWDIAIDQASGNWNSALAANGHSGRVYKNGTPVVGAVAQWEANHHGAGADGHVAYVQEVSNGGNTILVWQMNTNGQCNGPVSQTINRSDQGGSGLGWPSTFIHFDQVR